MPYLVWLLWTRRMSPFGLPIVPPPGTLTARHVTLTALGAHHHVLGTFDFPRDDQQPSDLQRLGITVPSVQAYEHITGLGRDQYVKVVKRGCLDTGHRASIVKITERRFEPVSLGTEPGPRGPVGVFGTRAVLRQYYRIIVTQPVLDYRPLAAGYPQGRREMPLRTIELRTLETPKIDLPISFTEEVTQDQIDHILGNPLWIRAAGKLVSVRLRQHRRRGPPGQPAQADAVHPVLVHRQHRWRHHRLQRGATDQPHRQRPGAQELALTETLPGKPRRHDVPRPST